MWIESHLEEGNKKFEIQDELKIGDDDFENFQSLFKLFDLDKDGILNFKEYEKLLRCQGHRLNGKSLFKAIIFMKNKADVFVSNKTLQIIFPEKQSQELAKIVSVDKINYSVSFNEFLKLMSIQQASEPDSEVLFDVFA